MPVPAESGPPLATIPVVMDVDEACELARRGRTEIYRAIKSGALPSVKSGRRRLIPGAGFKTWLAEGMPMEVVAH